jgi:hypothetical protein
MKGILLSLLRRFSLVGRSESGNETLGLQKCGEFPNCLSIIIFSVHCKSSMMDLEVKKHAKGQVKKTYQIFVMNVSGTEHLKGLIVDGAVILKGILQEQNETGRTILILPVVGAMNCLL